MKREIKLDLKIDIENYNKNQSIIFSMVSFTTKLSKGYCLSKMMMFLGQIATYYIKIFKYFGVTRISLSFVAL